MPFIFGAMLDSFSHGCEQTVRWRARSYEILQPYRTPYLTLQGGRGGVYGTNEASLFARVRALFPGKQSVFDLRVAFSTSNDSCL